MAWGVCQRKNAGSKKGPDVPIRLDKCGDCGAFVLPDAGCCPGKETFPVETGIETKTNGAFEAAGSKLKLTDAGLVIQNDI